MSDALAPIAPHFKTTAVTEIILKEKKVSFTGDSATIKTKDGATLFKIDAKLVSMSERRDLLDASGKVLGQLRKKKMPGIHKTVYIGTDNDEKKVAIVKKGLLDKLHCDADIQIGDKVVGEAKGNWRSKEFSITINGKEVAHASRKLSMASLALDADSYCIKIQPGVDQAFVSLIVIALDELYHEED